MQLEAGKYYMTRDGRKVGPMHKSGDNEPFVWFDGNGGCWSHSGEDGLAVGYIGTPTNGDIIAEWHDEQTENIDVFIEDQDPKRVLHLAVMSLTEKGHYEHAMSVLAILLDMSNE